MHRSAPESWTHDHVFDNDLKRDGESRTLIVVCVTAAMMVIEIVAGLAYGSMALLADGLHMASHTAALGLALVAYVVARRLARDSRFSFGVGKINTLAGFASAILLLGFAALMMTESVGRLMNPVEIVFDSALLVAVIGLVVNGLSAWILSSSSHHGGHGHAHEHGHGHGHGHGHHHHHHDHHHDDHNLRAAYLHVLADALTSILAIVALLAGKYFGAVWLDAAMGIVGAVLVTRWSIGLIRDSSRVLLDYQAAPEMLAQIRAALEARPGDRVTDLHVWTIGPGVRAAEVAVLSAEPETPGFYKARLPRDCGIAHATVEVHRASS
ncbi:CDF family Co(II)/Ni(II) efflux transporter DmeF [Thioalkalivibrio sp. XN279]|uniref:CDF family Co(II)/Ni(II) efflux transporter DmeF n=1 Tax=Thioalkalivibrio sp. XN279 TaxID=2714953 RepID=UPI00140C30F2|nr:CDF family Co(II)/Ni(II) efflux transporter DmeF [Thioalkalivibrio sp. XN279]NHA13956.1 CDF family Co(II)/Ni(II) efflux transporter DmeF [Thioalkalivibrio sp. XN279]